ncbi:hypothetical protein JTB14_022005 [Gonioctena quinquepunctata]|nr:hypothetical protein JTB14_022005 [Gonioctena quinquepunctata]
MTTRTKNTQKKRNKILFLNVKQKEEENAAINHKNELSKKQNKRENATKTMEHFQKKKPPDKSPTANIDDQKENQEQWIIPKRKKRTRPDPIRGVEEIKKGQLRGPVVTEYLNNKNFADITCEKMKTKKDKQKSSFKLEVPETLVDELMTPNVWMKGVIINHFYNLQRRQHYPRQSERRQHHRAPIA